MSDATHKIEGASPEEMAKRINFERLYSNWHAAMAAYNNPDGPDDDEHKEALAEKRDTAEIALLTAPAPLSFCIWQKWEVLDLLGDRGVPQRRTPGARADQGGPAPFGGRLRESGIRANARRPPGQLGGRFFFGVVTKTGS